MRKYKKKKRGGFVDTLMSAVNPQELAYELGLGAVTGLGQLAQKTVAGIVSAFQSKGATKSEIRALVAPLAKSLQYTSRKPRFTKAEGGLMIEHIENLPIGRSGHVDMLITTEMVHWLRGIASQFEEYQIKLWFAWNPICPATQTGQVLLAFDYDPADTGSGGYESPTDYFNTADHCVSAIWAPAALAPNKSQWLKTGTTGDSRLYSPGRLHIKTTDYTMGYLTVKYQVSLRKPQPDATDSSVIFSGVSGTTINGFNNPQYVSGDSGLISSFGDGVMVLTKTPGYKIVTWSTAGSTNYNYDSGNGGRTMGTRANVAGTTYVAAYGPGADSTLTLNFISPPSTVLTWRLTIQQVSNNPLDFTW